MWRKSTLQHFDLGAVISSLLKTPPLALPLSNYTRLQPADRGGAAPGAGLHVSPRPQCFSLVSGKVMTSTPRSRRRRGKQEMRLKQYMVLILNYIKQNGEPVNYLYLVKIYSIKQYIVNLLIFGKRFIMYISKQESNYCFWLTLQSQCQVYLQLKF